MDRRSYRRSPADLRREIGLPPVVRCQRVLECPSREGIRQVIAVFTHSNTLKVAVLFQWFLLSSQWHLKFDERAEIEGHFPLQTSWELRGVEGRHHVWGHGRLHGWSVGDVRLDSSTIQSLQDPDESPRKILLHELRHRSNQHLDYFTLNWTSMKMIKLIKNSVGW